MLHFTFAGGLFNDLRKPERCGQSFPDEFYKLYVVGRIVTEQVIDEYRFHLKDGHAYEDHAVHLDDDASAIAESLKTASGLLAELQLLDIGTVRHSLEIRANSETVSKIEIQVTRNR